MPSATPERPWLRWYGLKRWTRRSEMQLHAHPLCAMCLQRNLIVAASVADHIEPHRGDPIKFWFGELQSLCVDCHNRGKQQLETRGYTNDIDASGWPVDPNHPTNKAEKRDE
jgi:5-methylcytosine-specific restriction endonuclease McrA